MYRGCRALDTSRYGALEDSSTDEVSDPSSSHFAVPRKRSHTVDRTSSKDKILHVDLLPDALESLEIATANMTEFAVLLGGCERMFRRPYDAYLYTDIFMFGRHTEKQKLLTLLEEQIPPTVAPAVLPITGGPAVGKKTLVAHVWGDERVRSRFSSILHLDGEIFSRMPDQGQGLTMSRKMLVVVEFASDVADEAWEKFQSSVTRTSREIKVIIVSKLERLARFGSVKAIFLNFLSKDEFSYLFKALAFGSADPSIYPQLVKIADEFVKDMQLIGSLVSANAFAEVLRRNMDTQFWLRILKMNRRVVQTNISIYGVPPRKLLEQGHPVDVTDFNVHPLRTVPCRSDIPMKKGSPSATFGELLVDPTVMPNGEFNLFLWESRIPPYSSFSHFVPSCARDLPEDTLLSGRKRRVRPT